MPFLPDIAPITVLLIVGAYLLGSLSGRRGLGWLVARVRRGARSEPARAPEGWGVNAAGIAFDVAKGALAAWLALRHAPVGDALSVTSHGYLAAFAAALGQLWPVWHRFRGGDPSTVLAGGLLVLWPVAAAAWLIVGLLAWLLSGAAGLSIVAGALCLPLLAWWLGADPPRTWFAVAAAALVLLVHRGQLWRLGTGTEPRFARARRLHRWRRR